MVRRGASLDADQTSRQLLEERQDVAPLQLTADDNLVVRVDAVGLKNRLRDVETDCRNLLHDWLLRIVGALTAPTSVALACRVEEPSTASIGDIPSNSSGRVLSAARSVAYHVTAEFPVAGAPNSFGRTPESTSLSWRER